MEELLTVRGDVFHVFDMKQAEFAAERLHRLGKAREL